jgi:hypothetical protein
MKDYFGGLVYGLAFIIGVEIFTLLLKWGLYLKSIDTSIDDGMIHTGGLLLIVGDALFIIILIGMLQDCGYFKGEK